MKALLKRLRKINYRHYICIVITIGCLLCTAFLFTNAINRIIESFRDFGLSIAYYFCELFYIDNDISVTVTELPSLNLFPTTGAATVDIPETWELFKSSFKAYWQLWYSKSNFKGYMSALSDGLYWLCYGTLLVMPLFLVVIIMFRNAFNKQNNDYNKDSKPLKAFKKFTLFYQPVKEWAISFIDFIKKHKHYYIAWLLIWALNFNVITIFVEFLAYYLYFCISFDFLSIYKQFYKLAIDLATPINFIPWYIWVVIIIAVLDYVSKKRGYARLRHNERRNRGFLNERGVVTVVGGVMGAGKTALITDMALSAEVQLRDQAFEIILESDLKFPYFPWINLENELKRAIYYHEVFSVPSCRKWLHKKAARYNKSPCRGKIFDYDSERYGVTCDDKLKVYDIWEAAEDYACAYFIYIVQSSLLVANYSIRVDNLMSDMGNFPLWDGDFFKRDSRLQEAFSRHAHILDFDMLRLGKILLKDNPNRNAFGFGVYVITEIDKERKNTPELQEVKRNTDECNQKNDLFNVLLKMSRHACVISNRVFVKVLADLQRFGSLGGDVRELGEVVSIEAQSDISPVLPFYSPFYLFLLVYDMVFGKFTDMYVKYRYNRGDNSLLMYLIKSLASAMQRHYRNINNTFGCGVLSLCVESGKLDGEQYKRRWYKMPKKVYANRYSTDCLSGIFERRAELNNVGLDDLPEYSGIRASWEELQAQNSFFQNDIERVNSQVAASAVTSEPVSAAAESESTMQELGYNPEDILGKRSNNK